MSNDTILIVDDQVSTQSTLKGLLAGRGYRLTFASNGDDALKMVEQDPPDLILLDVMMPGIDGFAVCQHLKSSETWQHIPIILITALTSKEHLARGLDMGADDFLSKPFNSLELRARIRSMLRIKKQYDMLEVQKKQLEGTLQLREGMSNMIVHDMRNPLTTILGYCGLLLINEEISPENMKQIVAINQSADQLSRFASDLLLFAKTEHDHLKLNCSDVDLNQLILNVYDNHTISAQSKKINVITDLPAQPVELSLDKYLFQRVLDNLVSNALKYSPEGSTVRVQLVASSPTNTQINVSDGGPGIPVDDRERIFEKFITLPLKNRKVTQIGLGLSFVKMVIDAHEGRVFITENKPTGSVFTIEI